MPYLVIKSASNATPESYQLTSNIDKPRLVVSGSYIPLATNGGGSLKVADGNTTYYAMRTSTSSYSRSASASATFNTTAAASAGLSSTTALTRASTSATLTRASTSATYTRASTSATLTRASTSATLTRASTSATLTRASTYETLTRESVYGYSGYSIPTIAYGCTMGMSGTGGRTGNSWNIKNYGPVGATFFWAGGYSSRAIGAGGELGNYSGSAGAFTMQYPNPYPNIPSTNAIYGMDGYWNLRSSSAAGQGSPVYWTAPDTNGMVGYTALTRQSVYGYNTRQSVSGYATRESVSGYATRESVSGYGTISSVSGYGTRSSISAYGTCVSTSGYSGVSSSSSSSSESASGTCWR